MPVRIKAIEPESIAEQLGLHAGDEIISINGQAVADTIDFRFQTSEEELVLRIRQDGRLREERVEKDAYEPFGAELEEFRIRTCGDDCVFCFVDQNAPGLREALYVRDSDFRMSFLYGNYITLTNLRDRDMARIVEQRLSPMYISVHCTDDAIRRKMMGHKTQNDRLMEKMQFFRENEIEMHTQIVLVPGYNDGDALVKTVMDLFEMRDAIRSISIVPVGLTALRDNLTRLRGVLPEEASALIRQVHLWQKHFRSLIGNAFVYLADEMYLLAGAPFPEEQDYDGFPLIENGVGMCRDFLNEFNHQREEFPESLPAPRSVTMVTASLAAGVLNEHVMPHVNTIGNLSATVVQAKNTLFGDPVTVSGLLSYNCFVEAMRDRPPGDLVVLPPDCVNFEGLFLDNKSPDDLSAALGVPVRIFNGDWVELFEELVCEPVTG